MNVIFAPCCSLRFDPAERVGFEPTAVTRAATVFETVPFNHSGTSPDMPRVWYWVSRARQNYISDFGARMQFGVIDVLQTGIF